MIRSCTVSAMFVMCACSLNLSYHSDDSGDASDTSDTHDPTATSFVSTTFGNSNTSFVGTTVASDSESDTGFVEQDCCVPHSFPGCEDPTVQACMCELDLFCCEVQWDEACATNVNSFGCGFCEGGGSFTTFDSATDGFETETDTDSTGGGGIPEGDVRFGLVENHGEALTALDFQAALSAIAGPNSSGLELYQNLIDTYASEGGGRLPVEHCTGTLNGFPMVCDRLEAQQFDNVGAWIAIAAFNRVDMAPVDGANCGQQRIVFANPTPLGGSRMFIILEAEVPNPNPACGVAACQPIADAWEAIARQDAAERGESLRQLFLEGFSSLSPILTPEAFAVNAGQIRTNNFNDAPWTLREFKVVSQGAGVAPRVVPFPTADSPPGILWGDAAGDPLVQACQEAFLDALPNLLSDDPAAMSFPVPLACRDAESRNDFSQAYASMMAPQFAAQINARLAELDSDLDAIDVANRAQFSGSCMGCHQEAIGIDLGHGVTAPFSNGFVHVDEFGFSACPEGGNCRFLSSGLHSSFLPHRRSVMNDLLNIPACLPDVESVEEAFGIDHAPSDGDLSTIGGQSAAVTH